MHSFVSAVTRNLAAAALAIIPFIAVADDMPGEYEFVKELFPGVEVTAARPAPMAGWVEIEVGPEIFYVSEDQKLLIQGEVYDIESKTSLTQASKSKARLVYVDRFGDDESILFPAAEPMAEIIVFTDIDCGYCRKFHRQIAEYNDLGITVRYLFFPRSGPGTDSWAKAEAVWCADSQQDALTAAKNNEEFATEPCDASIVARHYDAVRELGVSGTPALLTTEGQLIIGYRDPAELLEILNAEI